jgi:hypothetical protein
MLVAYILIATCITILLGFPIAGALGLIAGVIFFGVLLAGSRGWTW